MSVISLSWRFTTASIGGRVLTLSSAGTVQARAGTAPGQVLTWTGTQVVFADPADSLPDVPADYAAQETAGTPYVLGVGLAGTPTWRRLTTGALAPLTLRADTTLFTADVTTYRADNAAA